MAFNVHASERLKFNKYLVNNEIFVIESDCGGGEGGRAGEGRGEGGGAGDDGGGGGEGPIIQVDFQSPSLSPFAGQ